MPAFFLKISITNCGQRFYFYFYPSNFNLWSLYLSCIVIVIQATFLLKCFRYLNNKKLMMIDTDCGVDDAMAIIMSLGMDARRGMWKVLAITTVRGNAMVKQVDENVLKVLHLFRNPKVKSKFI